MLKNTKSANFFSGNLGNLGNFKDTDTMSNFFNLNYIEGGHKRCLFSEDP